MEDPVLWLNHDIIALVMLAAGDGQWASVCGEENLESKKHLCMAMEYIEDGDCANMLKNIGPFPHVRYTS